MSAGGASAAMSPAGTPSSRTTVMRFARSVSAARGVTWPFRASRTVDPFGSTRASASVMMSNGFGAIGRLCGTLSPAQPWMRSSGRGAFSMPPTVLLTHDDILRRTREMAAEIRHDYANAGQLHLVCVLKGAFMFLADLV